MWGCNPKEKYSAIDLSLFYDGIHHWNLLHDQTSYARYSEDQITQIANNFLKFQNIDGGWPKNMDWLANINIDSLLNTLSDREKQSTIDNNNVYSQIEYLSKVYLLTSDEKYKKSAQKGLLYLLRTQNRSGGWHGWDVDAITFNDQVMTGVMNLFQDIIENKEYYNWVNLNLRDSIQNSLNKAIEVTLKCQIVRDGQKTAWCQQHDHITYKPVKARTYELPSITAHESVDVVRFLMRLPNPTDSVKESINSAISWLEKSKIYGIRLKKIKLEDSLLINKEYPYDLVVVHDSLAKPIWGRYYDIETNTPFLCRRDGTIVYNLKEIGPERRTGYSWYGYWPEELLQKDYPAWLKENKL